MTSFLGDTTDWSDTFEGVGEIMDAIATYILPSFVKIVLIILVLSFVVGILGAILAMIRHKMSKGI